MRRKRFVTVHIFTLAGHRVRSVDDARDVLGLWNVCDFDALREVAAAVGREIGRQVEDVFMSGGSLYAKCRT